MKKLRSKRAKRKADQVRVLDQTVAQTALEQGQHNCNGAQTAPEHHNDDQEALHPAYRSLPVRTSRGKSRYDFEAGLADQQQHRARCDQCHRRHHQSIRSGRDTSSPFSTRVNETFSILVMAARQPLATSHAYPQ